MAKKKKSFSAKNVRARTRRAERRLSRLQSNPPSKMKTAVSKGPSKRRLKSIERLRVRTEQKLAKSTARAKARAQKIQEIQALREQRARLRALKKGYKQHFRGEDKRRQKEVRQRKKAYEEEARYKKKVAAWEEATLKKDLRRAGREREQGLVQKRKRMQKWYEKQKFREEDRLAREAAREKKRRDFIGPPAPKRKLAKPRGPKAGKKKSSVLGDVAQFFRLDTSKSSAQVSWLYKLLSQFYKAGARQVAARGHLPQRMVGAVGMTGGILKAQIGALASNAVMSEIGFGLQASMNAMGVIFGHKSGILPAILNIVRAFKVAGNLKQLASAYALTDGAAPTPQWLKNFAPPLEEHEKAKELGDLAVSNMKARILAEKYVEHERAHAHDYLKLTEKAVRALSEDDLDPLVDMEYWRSRSTRSSR